MIVESIESLKSVIRESKERNFEGVKLAQQSIENYISKVLDMDIIESENLGSENSYRDVIRVVAQSGEGEVDSKFTFESEYYSFDEFTPRGDSITLKKIEGSAGVHEVEHTFYMASHSDEFNKKHELLNTPLDKIISGEVEDVELSFVVDLLKQKLKGLDGYNYIENQKENIKTFLINLNDEVRIETGMSNTIQVSFNKERFQTFQIIYRKRPQKEIIKEIDELSEFLENYLSWNITLEGHDISQLYDYLQSKRIIQDVITTSLMKDEVDYVQFVQLFQDIVIGEWDSYGQVNLSIKYNRESKQIELIANYLFNEIKVVCNNVEEVEKAIKEIEELL